VGDSVLARGMRRGSAQIAAAKEMLGKLDWLDYLEPLVRMELTVLLELITMKKDLKEIQEHQDLMVYQE